jgi:DNA-binding transcriptional MerR regulator
MTELAEPLIGFSTRLVCEIAGVAPSTLNSWAAGESPLIQPSILGPDGKRSDRYWSVRDLVAVRAIKALRQAGCPLQQLRKASELVALDWGAHLGEVVLYWDGADLIAVNSWGHVQSLIQHPGQQMFQLVAIPLDEWRAAAEPLASAIDLDAIRTRRNKRAGRSRRPEVARSLGQSQI